MTYNDGKGVEGEVLRLKNDKANHGAEEGDGDKADVDGDLHGLVDGVDAVFVHSEVAVGLLGACDEIAAVYGDRKVALG